MKSFPPGNRGGPKVQSYHMSASSAPSSRTLLCDSCSWTTLSANFPLTWFCWDYHRSGPAFCSIVLLWVLACCACVAVLRSDKLTREGDCSFPCSGKATSAQPLTTPRPRPSPPLCPPSCPSPRPPLPPRPCPPACSPTASPCREASPTLWRPETSPRWFLCDTWPQWWFCESWEPRRKH